MVGKDALPETRMTLATDACAALGCTIEELALLLGESDFTARTWEEDERNLRPTQRVMCALLRAEPRQIAWRIIQHRLDDVSPGDERREKLVVLSRRFL